MMRRATNVEKLQAGVRIGALDDLLFPKDPIADAPRIINELRTFFPYAAGSLTIGPFLELGFLKPQIIILRVGVIFQCDQVAPGASDRDVTRILVLGQVLVSVPPRSTSRPSRSSATSSGSSTCRRRASCSAPGCATRPWRGSR